jgi:hypothetical protein
VRLGVGWGGWSAQWRGPKGGRGAARPAASAGARSCSEHPSSLTAARPLGAAPPGEPLLTSETIEHVTSVVAERGSDAWWQLPIEDLLPPGLRHLAPTLRKGEDTMDVWFDSGSSWAGVVQAGAESGLRFPADLYLEGSDQHRGGWWFGGWPWFGGGRARAGGAGWRQPERLV